MTSVDRIDVAQQQELAESRRIGHCQFNIKGWIHALDIPTYLHVDRQLKEENLHVVVQELAQGDTLPAALPGGGVRRSVCGRVRRSQGGGEV